MNITKLKVNAMMFYFFLASLPSLYTLYTYGRVGILVGVLHIIFSLVMLLWYMFGVLAR